MRKEQKKNIKGGVCKDTWIVEAQLGRSLGKAYLVQPRRREIRWPQVDSPSSQGKRSLETWASAHGLGKKAPKFCL